MALLVCSHDWVIFCYMDVLRLLSGSRVGPHVGCAQVFGAGNSANMGLLVVFPCAHRSFPGVYAEEWSCWVREFSHLFCDMLCVSQHESELQLLNAGFCIHRGLLLPMGL